MLNRQTLIALGVALLLAFGAVFIANNYLTKSQAKADLGGTTKVAVAAVPLAYGMDITPDKIRFADFPNNSLPAGAFTNAAQLTGKKHVALMPIGINEPILSAKISGEGQGASIAALLPEGMRAASVRINDVSGVSGFVQPNDSVDVLITRTIAGGTGSVQMTDVLLQNARVIAIDQEAKNSDGSPKVAKTATLEVTPLDAQKLALAQEAGSLSLVLRKPGETNNPVVETVSMNDLRYNVYGGARYPAPAVVGNFGSAVGGSLNRSAALIASAGSGAGTSRPAAHKATSKKPKAAPDPGIEVYRGVVSDKAKAGEHGR
jgi:pilus assembly protein CpaB